MNKELIETVVLKGSSMGLSFDVQDDNNKEIVFVLDNDTVKLMIDLVKKEYIIEIFPLNVGCASGDIKSVLFKDIDSAINCMLVWDYTLNVLKDAMSPIKELGLI